MTDAEKTDSVRALTEAVRQKMENIPLLTPDAGRMLQKEKNHACFFTGHRDIMAPAGMETERFQKRVREWLENQVTSMIYSGYSTFLCGGARGFDLLAAAAVLQEKPYHDDLRLILLLPCREQTRGWNARDLALYLAVLERAEAFYLQPSYDRGCMHRRNRMLVDLSITGLAYYDPAKYRSGTGMTVRYAEGMGVPLHFLPLDDKSGTASAGADTEDGR